MDDFTNITTEDEFIEYLQLQLSAPVNNLEIANEQYRSCLADAFLEYSRYGSGDANFQEWCILNLSAGQNYYPVSGVYSVIDQAPVQNVQSVTGIEISTNLDGINNLFTPSHLILMEQNGGLMNSWANKFGPLVSTMGQGNPLASYTTAMMYLKSINELFSHSLTMKFIQGKQILQTTPTPTVGGPCIICLMRSVNVKEMYNLISFRKLALSKVMTVYGRNLSKYSGTLPDGLTINYDLVRNEAKDLYTEAIALIKSESESIDFFVY